MLQALEHIEKAFRTEKECKWPKAHVTGGGSSKKRMVSFSDRIPKMIHKEAKHCNLCKQHRGEHNTHSITECRMYEKNGTPKWAFAGKSGQQHNPCNRNVRA
jgi:hypothetical protein